MEQLSLVNKINLLLTTNQKKQKERAKWIFVPGN